MKLKVLQKGLVIVVTPLLIELFLIGALACLVVATDQQQTLATRDRNLGIVTSRLTFSHIHAIAYLNAAGLKPDFLLLYQKQKERSDDYLLVLKSLQADLTGSERILSNNVVEAETFVMKTLDQLASVMREGLSIEIRQRLFEIEDSACKRLNEEHALMSQFYAQINKSVQQEQSYLQQLYQTGSSIILLGLALNFSAAYVLMKFFQSQFTDRIAVIANNVLLASHKLPLNRAISGEDEISDLDRSFHEMHRQLLAAEEKETALFNNSSDIICILDQQLAIKRINNATRLIIGYPPEALTEKELSSLLPEDSAQRVKSELHQARSTGKPSSFESQIRTESGETVNLLWSAIWAEGEQCWYCILHDISEQKKIESAQRNLVRLIASDLEQPLLRISSIVNRLGSECQSMLPEAFLTKLSRMGKSLPRLVKLVGELLQIEHLQSTELALEHVSGTAEKVLEDAIRDVEATAASKRIDIETSCDRIDWQVDEEKLVRVLVNLLSNAVKFSPEGSTISVSCICENNFAHFKVADQGRGIPADVLPSLFQPFQQVAAADGHRGKGSGLGLVICKRIVEQHGGEIGVVSEPGKGSCFWFRVPIQKSLPKHEKVEAIAEPQSSAEVESPDTESKETAHPASSKLRMFRPGASLKKKGLLLAMVPLVFEIAFVAGMLSMLKQGESNVRRQIHDSELSIPTVGLTIGLAALAYSASSRARDNINSTDPNSYVQQLTEANRQFIAAAKGDPQAEELERQIAPTLKPLNQIVSKLNNMGESASIMDYYAIASRILNTSDRIARQVEHLLDLLDARNHTAGEQEVHTRTVMSGILIAGLLLNVLTALALAVIFSRDIAVRLKALSSNCDRFANRLTLIPAIPGADEIAQLDKDFHSTARELAERRAKERAFMDNARSIICALNADGIFVTSNPAASRLLRLSAAKLAGISLFSLLKESDASAIRRVLNQAKEDRLPHQFESQLRLDGRDIDLLWSVSWSATEQNYFCVAHDVTQRKNLERLKQEFIGIITHDLRSPMTTVYGISHGAVHRLFGDLPAEPVELLKQMTHESERVIELVNDILDLDKLEAGKLDFELSAVDVEGLLEDSVEQVANQSPRIEIISSNQASLSADSERLSLALAGLMMELQSCRPLASRAVCIANESVSIHLTADVCEAEVKILDSLVERLSGSGDAPPGTIGSRMRLQLSRKIIEAHGGRIKATRRKNNIALEIEFPASVIASGGAI
jgi:PAS domain S-box-containing protein